MFVIIHHKEDKLQYFLTGFIRLQANSVNLNPIPLYVNKCHRNESNGLRMNVNNQLFIEETDTYLRCPDHHTSMSKTNQKCVN